MNSGPISFTYTLQYGVESGTNNDRQEENCFNTLDYIGMYVNEMK
jgi:hypothetical protein